MSVVRIGRIERRATGALSALLHLFPFWNRAERRPRALLRLTTHALLAVGAGLAPLPARYMPRGPPRDAMVMGLVCVTLFVITAVVASALDRRALGGLGLRLDRRWLEELAFGTALGGALMAGILLTEERLGWAHYTWAHPGAAASARVVPIVASLIVFVAVAINEELVFRAYHITNLTEGLTFPGRLSSRSATVLALILSSCVFGFAHLGNPAASWVSTLNITLAGWMLAAGFVLTGRLAISIGLHLGWNYFQNLFGMPVSGLEDYGYGAVLAREPDAPAWLIGGAFGPEAGVTGLLAIVVGTALVLAYVKARGGSLRVEPTMTVTLPPPVSEREAVS